MTESIFQTSKIKKINSLDSVLKRAKLILFQQNLDLPEYPVDNLGPLARVAQAIASEGQTDIALAGQSVLGAAALCAQACANVETPSGAVPLSIYLLTIGESGDGKTTAENVALQSIRSYVRNEVKKYDIQKKEYRKNKPESVTSNVEHLFNCMIFKERSFKIDLSNHSPGR